jgi:hypothetical protein
MKIDRASLERRFGEMSDGELLDCLDDDLTELAREVGIAEAARRGLALTEPIAAEGQAGSAASGYGPLRICARFINPLNAEVFALCLDSHGISAHVMDGGTIYASGVLFGSLMRGGVRVMVHASQLEEAKEIRAAFDAGEYAIGEDFDVGK